VGKDLFFLIDCKDSPSNGESLGNYIYKARNLLGVPNSRIDKPEATLLKRFVD
jgi:hypothetical protein